jgi:hypothetical protein
MAHSYSENITCLWSSFRLDLLTLYLQSLLTAINYSDISIYPLHKSLGHAKSSQSSLVVSWQRIYSSLTVTTAHIKSFRRLTPLYSFVLLCTNSVLILVLPPLLFCTPTTTIFRTRLSYIHSAPTPRKTLSQQFVGVFTAPPPSNGRLIVPRYASAGMC